MELSKKNEEKGNLLSTGNNVRRIHLMVLSNSRSTMKLVRK